VVDLLFGTITRKPKRKYGTSTHCCPYPDVFVVRSKKKADTWALQNWIHDAQIRAQEFHHYGSPNPVTWVLTNGKNIPPGAIEGGCDQGHTLYIARAYQDVSRVVCCVHI
jgi:hypothetical protein